MSNKTRKRSWFFLVGGLLLAGAIWAASAGAGWSSKESGTIEGRAVERGTLRISVVERGNLKAAHSVSLKNEVEGETRILSMPIKNGAEVQAGELLCTLDTSELELRRVQQEIQVQNSEAEHVKATQTHEIQQSQNESDIEEAERLLEFARLDLRKYLEGDRPQLLQKADEDILLRDEELKRAEQDLSWSEQLAARGFLEQTQLDADRLAKTRSEVALKQAQRAKELLELFEIPRKVRELEAEAKEREAELERVGLRARARIVDFEADVRTSQAKLDLEREELAKLVSQIEKATIRAPVAGTVVFTIEDRGRWGGGTPIQEGATVREGQEIMTIPSSDSFLAEASLHESVLEKVREGMSCIVTVDALQRSVPGVLRYKARQHDQNAWFANPDLRVYKTEIELLESDPRMRPGMSCSVEILVDEISGALYVPVQCIFADGEGHVAFAKEKGGIVKRQVEIGQNNAKWVEVLAGLSEGEIVFLSQPPGFNLAPAPDQGRPETEGAWDAAQQAATGAGGPGASAPMSSSREGSAERGPRDRESGRDQGGEDRGADGERWKKALEEAQDDPAKLEELRKEMQERSGRGDSSEPGAEARSSAETAPSAAERKTPASSSEGSR